MRLADNRLTGPVPPELGQLIWLRGLDLARNPLSGCLPPSVQVKCDSCPDLPICPSPPRPEAGAPACPPQGPSPSLACDKEILLSIRDTLWGPKTFWPQSWQPDTPLQEGFHWGESGGYHPSLNDAEQEFTEGFHGVRVRGNPPRVIGLTVGGDFALEPDPGGTIPPELGRLAWLQKLALIGSLSGPIPPELGQLALLENLYLPNNLLSGSVPPELGQLALLEELHLDGNALTGCLPAAWRDRFGGEPQNLPYCPLADLQPEQPEVNQPTMGPDTFVSVSAGMAHACGVRDDGTLACWGHDHFWSGHTAGRHLCDCQCRCTPYLRRAERRHACLLGRLLLRAGHTAARQVRDRQCRQPAHLCGGDERQHRLLGRQRLWTGPDRCAGRLHGRQCGLHPHLRGTGGPQPGLLGRRCAGMGHATEWDFLHCFGWQQAHLRLADGWFGRLLGLRLPRRTLATGRDLHDRQRPGSVHLWTAYRRHPGLLGAEPFRARITTVRNLHAHERRWSARLCGPDRRRGRLLG